MKKAKRNANGMIVLYLGHDIATYMTAAGEFKDLAALKRAGKKLIKNNTLCAGLLSARVYAYQKINGNMVYMW